MRDDCQYGIKKKHEMLLTQTESATVVSGGKRDRAYLTLKCLDFAPSLEDSLLLLREVNRHDVDRKATKSESKTA